MKRTGSLLLVEDSETDRELVDLAIRRLDPATPCVWVRSANEALDVLRASPIGRFSLVVCDLNLSGIPALGFIAQAKREFPEIPVVAYSGSSNPADSAASYRAGAAGYITKGVTLSEVFDQVNLMFEFWSNFKHGLPSTGLNLDVE